MLKKIVCALSCALLLMTSAGAEWSGFRTAENSIIGAESAMESSEIEVRLSVGFPESEALGAPAVDSESIYITVGSILQKISKTDGKIETEYKGDKVFNTDYPPVILGGCVAVAVKDGIAVLNTADLSLKYSFTADGYEICTPLTMSGDIAYFGAVKDGAGAYFAVRDGQEIWRYESEKGFADCGAVIHKNRLIFGSEEGNAVSHSLESDEYTLLALGGAVASTPFADEYAVYMTSDNGYAHKFRLNDNGSFENGTLSSCFIDEAKLSSPLVNMGRVYVGAAGKPFAVLDSLNMQVVYRIDGISSTSAPVVTVANGARVLVFSENAPYYIYSIYDYETLNEGKFTPIAQFADYDGSMKSVVIDTDGVMYVKAAPHTLAVLGYKGLDYFVIAIKLILITALFVLFVVWLRVLNKKSKDKKSPFLRR